MQTYAQFRPTGFDCKGLGLPDRQDWLVLPCARNRDSNTYEESNFAVALARVESALGVLYSPEVHRFDHWGPGWFEIILVHPDYIDVVQEIENSLVQYPLLDEMDHSEREYEAACKAWEHMSLRERVHLAGRFDFHFMAARRDELPQGEVGELVSYLADGC